MYKYILTANYLVFFVFVSSESPSCDHKRYECGVVFDLSGHGGIVIVPLVSRNGTTSVLFAKGRQEFNENIMRRHFAADNFRVLRRVEDVL